MAFGFLRTLGSRSSPHPTGATQLSLVLSERVLFVIRGSCSGPLIRLSAFLLLCLFGVAVCDGDALAFPVGPSTDDNSEFFVVRNKANT